MTPQARIMLIGAIVLGAIALLSRVAFAVLGIEADASLAEALSGITAFVVGLVFRSPMSYREAAPAPVPAANEEPRASDSTEVLR